jgi:hypothetical protein
MLMLALVVYLVISFICAVAVISACILSGRIEAAYETKPHPEAPETPPAAELPSPAERPASSSSLVLQNVP